jgi:hypothetical protein
MDLRWAQAVAAMRKDTSESLAVGVMGVGTGVEVYERVRLTMEGGVAVAVAVVAVCLRRRAWSLRRAAAERLPLRTIERSLCANCSLACSFG